MVILLSHTFHVVEPLDMASLNLSKFFSKATKMVQWLKAITTN
jgi:hypothetical protein